MTDFAMSRETDELFGEHIGNVIAQARRLEMALLQTLALADEANSRPSTSIGVPLKGPDLQRKVKKKCASRSTPIHKISLKSAIELLEEELEKNWKSAGAIPGLLEAIDALKSGDPDAIRLRNLCAHGWWSEPGYHIGQALRARLENRRLEPASFVLVESGRGERYEVTAEQLSDVVGKFVTCRNEVRGLRSAILDLWARND